MREKRWIKGLILAIVCIILGLTGIKVRQNINFVNAINLEEEKPINKIDTEKKEVFLTFDINWAEDDKTIEILDVLDKYKVKATFFIMGKWVKFPKGNEEKLVEISKRGHLIGNHSYVHPDFKEISGERIEKEVLDTEKIIEESIGVKTKIFRFPSGSYNKEAVKKIYSLGYLPIEWNIDSKDWRNRGQEEEYNNVKKKIEKGSIILYHNNGKYTPENLEKLIIELEKEGYEFKILPEKIKN